MLAATPSTADSPRAHIMNMAALECLRDIGLEEECKMVAVKGDCMQHTRWCRSMAGEEFARVYSWGNDPTRAVCVTYAYILALSDHNREIMLPPVPAAISIFHRPTSNPSLFAMRPITAFNAASIPRSSLSTASLMGVLSAKSLITYPSRRIRYGLSTYLVVMELEVRFCGN